MGDLFGETSLWRSVGVEPCGRDCHLAYQYSIGKLRHEFAHWHGDAPLTRADTLYLDATDGDAVRAWFAGLHPTEVME